MHAHTVFTSGRTGVTGRYKMVDRRMLSDKRGEDNAARRKKRKQKRKHR